MINNIVTYIHPFTCPLTTHFFFSNRSAFSRLFPPRRSGGVNHLPTVLVPAEYALLVGEGGYPPCANHGIVLTHALPVNREAVGLAVVDQEGTSEAAPSVAISAIDRVRSVAIDEERGTGIASSESASGRPTPDKLEVRPQHHRPPLQPWGGGGRRRLLFQHCAHQYFANGLKELLTAEKNCRKRCV